MRVPLTNKRIDFIIAGEDAENNKNVIVVELKQWEKVKHTDMYDIVMLGKEQLVHPSWQAFSYETWKPDLRISTRGSYNMPFTTVMIEDISEEDN